MDEEDGFELIGPKTPTSLNLQRNSKAFSVNSEEDFVPNTLKLSSVLLMDEKNDDPEITEQTKKRVIQSFDLGNKTKKDTLLNHQSKTTAVVENKELVEEAVT